MVVLRKRGGIGLISDVESSGDEGSRSGRGVIWIVLGRGVLVGEKKVMRK